MLKALTLKNIQKDTNIITKKLSEEVKV